MSFKLQFKWWVVIGLVVVTLPCTSWSQEEDFSDFADEDFSDVEFDAGSGEAENFDDLEFEEEASEDMVVEEEPTPVPESEENFVEDVPAEEPSLFTEDELQEPPTAEEPVVEEELPFEMTPSEPLAEELTSPAVADPIQLDTPNLELEARWHDLYQKFHKEKTQADVWEGVAGSRMSEVYRIQKNDKLWSISETLFGDGHYWPKVWSLNSSIKNPHIINEDNEIRFVLGDESGPPAFTISEKGQSDVDIPMSESSGGRADEPEIPPPLVKSQPVVKRLPPSLPRWQVLGESGEFDKLGIDYGRRKITELKVRMPLGAYISEREPSSLGYVHEMEAGSQMASEMQYIYLNLEPGTAQVGDRLLVIRNQGEVEKVNAHVEGFLGYSIEVQGEVKLVEQLPSRDGEDALVFRAIISKLVNPVTKGSLVVPGRVEYLTLDEAGERSQVVAQFIGGQYFNRRQVYGAESIAYINRGVDQGLRVGQILSVRENRRVRNSETTVGVNVRPIGWVKVVKVEPNFSTVVVVKAWSDIMTGDLTGAGELASSEVQSRPEGSVDTAASLKEILDEPDRGNEPFKENSAPAQDVGNGGGSTDGDDFGGFEEFEGEEFEDEEF